MLQGKYIFYHRITLTLESWLRARLPKSLLILILAYVLHI